MNTTQRKALIATVLLVAATGAWLVWGYRSQHPAGQEARPGDPVQATRQLWAQQLRDVKGIEQPLKQWQGKLLVVNLWATWCAPCRAEMPAFSRLQDKYAAKGVQFVGITLDSPTRVEEYAAQTPTRYPLLIGSHTLIPVFAGLGNVAGSVPFTVILGRDGQVIRAHQGYWKEAALDAILSELN
jgi:thiol-disulfide isomerase/thioredoxin